MWGNDAIVELPEALGRKWHNRGYHGTLHHDVRAVYTKELGMWDGDPVSLHPHPPVESAKRYIDLLGAGMVLDEGRRALAEADYRWAAEILHKLVFAQPDNTEARELQADAYEQLGYQAEGPTVARDLPVGGEGTARRRPAGHLHQRQPRHRRGDAGRHPLRLRRRPRHRGIAALLQPGAAEKLLATVAIQVTGDPSALTAFSGLMDAFDPDFAIVTPRR